ncbi:MAG: hypothetical protein MJ025_05135, partial [Victivallaceae bacterium]|nr:hypothetical protein [Victivallaceae bacterium]
VRPAVVDELRERDRPAVMLYVSDPGSSVKDGRSSEMRSYKAVNIDAYEIPMLLYMSPAYVSRFGGFAARARAAVHHPLQTDRLFWGMVSLCQVSCDDLAPEKDFFSNKFVPAEKRYLGEGTLVYHKGMANPGK